MVEVPRTRDSVLKSVATQVDSFKLGAGDGPEGAPLVTKTETFLIHTSLGRTCRARRLRKAAVRCEVRDRRVPRDDEAQRIQRGSRAAIEVHHRDLDDEPLASEEATPVNVGLQTSYKEFSAGEFFGEPPANGGVLSIGSDPLPKAVY